MPYLSLPDFFLISCSTKIEILKTSQTTQLLSISNAVFILFPPLSLSIPLPLPFMISLFLLVYTKMALKLIGWTSKMTTYWTIDQVSFLHVCLLPNRQFLDLPLVQFLNCRTKWKIKEWCYWFLFIYLFFNLVF